MVCTVQNREELDQKLAEAKEQDKLVVIDFYANWCGPCKIISPKLDELSLLYADKTCMLKVNVDDNEDIALDYNVTSLPTFVFIKSDKIIEVFIGGNTEKLVKSVEKFVGEAIQLVAPEAEEEAGAMAVNVEITEPTP